MVVESDITWVLDLEKASLSNLKCLCVISSRSFSPWALGDNSTISSAKNKEEIFNGPRSIPSPVELSSLPRLLIKRENRRGLRLQPVRKDVFFNKIKVH